MRASQDATPLELFDASQEIAGRERDHLPDQIGAKVRPRAAVQPSRATVCTSRRSKRSAMSCSSVLENDGSPISSARAISIAKNGLPSLSLYTRSGSTAVDT